MPFFNLNCYNFRIQMQFRNLFQARHPMSSKKVLGNVQTSLSSRARGIPQQIFIKRLHPTSVRYHFIFIPRWILLDTWLHHRCWLSYGIVEFKTTCPRLSEGCDSGAGILGCSRIPTSFLFAITSGALFKEY